MLYSGFYKGRIKHGGQLWAFQTASFRLLDTLICVLEAEPVPAALTQAVGRGLVDEDAEIDAALPVGSPPRLWSTAFLPCVLTYFFFSIFWAPAFYGKVCTAQCIFPSSWFSLISPFFLLPSFCFFPQYADAICWETVSAFLVIKSLAGASVTVILEMLLPVWSWQEAGVLQQGLGAGDAGMFAGWVGHWGRGTHEKPIAGAVSTPGTSQLRYLNCCPLEKQL